MQKLGRHVQLWVLVLVVGFLAACSPEYNWREVSVSQDVGMVLFPAKPRTQTRDLDFGGNTLTFNLTTAEIDDITFAVGHAAWPESLQDDDTLRDKLGKSVIASLYRNLGHDEPSTLPSYGERFEIRREQDDMLVLSQVWISNTGLIQGIVMGPGHEFPQDAAHEFLASLERDR